MFAVAQGHVPNLFASTRLRVVFFWLRPLVESGEHAIRHRGGIRSQDIERRNRNKGRSISSEVVSDSWRVGAPFMFTAKGFCDCGVVFGYQNSRGFRK